MIKTERECIEELVGAILRQAVSDYVHAYAIYYELEPKVAEIEEMIKWSRHPALVTIEQLEKLSKCGAKVFIADGQLMIRYGVKTDMGKLKQCRSDIKDLEKFFRGEWYATLTDLDPEYLLSEGKRQARRLCKERQKVYVWEYELNGKTFVAASPEEVGEAIGATRKQVVSAVGKGHRCQGHRVIRREKDD